MRRTLGKTALENLHFACCSAIRNCISDTAHQVTISFIFGKKTGVVTHPQPEKIMKENCRRSWGIYRKISRAVEGLPLPGSRAAGQTVPMALLSLIMGLNRNPIGSMVDKIAPSHCCTRTQGLTMISVPIWWTSALPGAVTLCRLLRYSRGQLD